MADEPQDWFKVYRRLRENHFLMHDDTALVVFIKLLLIVGKLKGEWSGSVRQLAETDIFKSINYTTLYKTLKRLEKEQIIKQSSKQKSTTITICKWHKYQERKGATKGAMGKQWVSNEGAMGKQSSGVKKIQNKKENKKYSEFEFLEPALSEFVEMRKLIKKPLTHTALIRKVARLEKMYPGEHDRQQAVLLQSVDHNWQDLYELKRETVGARKETDGWL